jgi:hypothetical protein
MSDWLGAIGSLFSSAAPEATAEDLAASSAASATAGGAIDPVIGWTEDPYTSAQTVPQIATPGGVFDSGSGMNPNSWLAQQLPGWLGGSFTPAAGSSLQGALSTLNKAGGGSEKAGGPAPMQMQNAQAPQGAGVSHSSSGAGELAALLAALDARRNLLLQSATSGQARPVGNPASPAAGGATRQTTGLLGI